MSHTHDKRHNRGARAALVLLTGLLASSGAMAGITGVCPDGSMFIVKRAAQIPCKNAKRVDPNDVPPVRPLLVPRPYGWEKFHREQDPNNPYNLIDGEGAPVTIAAPPPTPTPAPAPAPAPEQVTASAPLAPLAAAPVDVTAGLSDQEIVDLAKIVAITQRLAPAHFARRNEVGTETVQLSLAHSVSFASRLRDAWAQRGRISDGPVVLFLAQAEDPGSFHGNLTFVQGSVAFHANPANPAQFGILHGRLGDLESGASVLGYFVLPDHIDLGQPVDVYWDDYRLTATLTP
jgi:hypothetical protein